MKAHEVQQREKRILLLSEIFPPANGGSGRWFSELYPRIENIRTTYCLDEGDWTPEFDDKFPGEIIRMALHMPDRSVRGIQNLRRYWSDASRIGKLAKSHGIDEIHAARPLNEGLVARLVRLRTGIPYRCFVHGEDISVARTSRELSIVTNRVLRGAKRVITNSSYTHELVRREWKIAPEQIDAFTPGVNVDYFRPSEDREVVRKKLGWHHSMILLTVGRLQRRKGHDVAIDAVSKLQSRHPNLRYVIVGDGEDFERLSELARTLEVTDRIEFRRDVDDGELLECYQACDVFALPNRTIGGDVEGFGMVLVEAQACQRPVIAGNSGGTIDTLDDGQTGRLLNCNNSDQLVETLDEWLGNEPLRQRLGNAGREYVTRLYSWDALAEKASRSFVTQSEC